MRKQAPLHMLYLLTFNLVLFYPVSVLAAENKEGKFYGAKMTEYPDWFKESFLNFPDDIEEAKESGKRLVVFFFFF